MKRVAVVGGGIAGVAAAWAAKRRGAEVVLIRGRAGASSMTSGAVDDRPWDSPRSASETSLSTDAVSFVEALGIWSINATDARIATSSGVLRRARGADRSLLDFASMRSKTIGVARVSRPGWDADWLATSLGESSFAKRAELRFVAVDLPLLLRDDERFLPDLDLAARHDDAERAQWLAERIRLARREAKLDAMLLGPWLGQSHAAIAAEISSLSRTLVGEVTSMPGGAAGARLDAALTRLIESSSIASVRGDAVVHGEDGAYVIAGAELDATFDAVVLAIGGVAAGGITLTRVDPTVVSGPSPHFRASSWEDAAFGWDSENRASSALPSLAWRDGSGVLERAGIRHRDGFAIDRSEQPRRALFVVGDARADEPRTVLQALESGLSAGARAAS